MTNIENFNVPISVSTLRMSQNIMPNMSYVSFAERVKGLSKAEIATALAVAKKQTGKSDPKDIVFVTQKGLAILNNRINDSIPAAGDVLNDDGTIEDDGQGAIIPFATIEESASVESKGDKKDRVPTCMEYTNNMVKTIKVTAFRNKEGQIKEIVSVGYDEQPGTPARYKNFALKQTFSYGELQALFAEHPNLPTGVYANKDDSKMVYKIAIVGDEVIKQRAFKPTKEGQAVKWYTYRVSLKRLRQAVALFNKHLKEDAKAQENLKTYNKTGKTYPVQAPTTRTVIN